MNTTQFVTLLKDNINNMNNLSIEQVEELGINSNINEDEQAGQFISVKCFNCYNVLGVFDSFNKKYIIFNAI